MLASRRNANLSVKLTVLFVRNAINLITPLISLVGQSVGLLIDCIMEVVISEDVHNSLGILSVPTAPLASI